MVMANNMIFPVNDDKTPACKGWLDYESEKIGSFRGLAVKMNPRLNILDIDRKDWVKGEPNVLTAKGAHYWFIPEQNVTTKHGEGYDIKTNGYVVFHGKDKQFNHENLHTWRELEDSFDFLSSNDLDDGFYSGDSTDGVTCRDSLEGLTVEQSGVSIFKKRVTHKKVPTYVKLVEDSTGYVVDVDRYEKAQCTQMEGLPVGTRNDRLFRMAIEFHRLGIETSNLEKAAMHAGLETRDIDRTIASAYARWENDEGVSLLDRVAIWLGAVEQMNPTTMQWDVAQYVARCALEQHSMAPQVSQMRAARDVDSLSQKYAGTVMNTAMAQRGLLGKIVRPGKQANGFDHCNNYHLMIDGVALENIKLTDVA
ncbi:hypothetical protein BJF84_00125 [Rhodococcus sp. CUA-806]|nr:hypothetical protein BJF84_00125 [Rhodococcus sp. CUA-806]